MSDPSNNGDLREISGVARKSHLTQEDARAMILAGVPFGGVFPQLDSRDHAEFREWFVRDDAVTAARRAAYNPVPVKNHSIRPATPPAAQSAYPSGEFCKCGGLIVQDGKCRKCSGGCGYSEGSCS